MLETTPTVESFCIDPHNFISEMGVVLLDTLCCMLSTEEGSLFTFLVTFSSSLLHLPCPEWPDACQEIVSRLCHYVLPSCLCTSEYSGNSDTAEP